MDTERESTPWSDGTRRVRRWIGRGKLSDEKMTITLGVLPDGRWFVGSAQASWTMWQPFDREQDAVAVAERLAAGMREAPVHREPAVYRSVAAVPDLVGVAA
ncbi:hypothetical protein HDA40_007508 [Hamadaea flava]|uniref:DUF1508 domain-containing protein n=1 Tax=Hamadaea flava TaxID=1742688 RepID=A0ABV8LZ55_9ACTN|nr:hypothetical protein [Hamadaea flava]MCP2329001.1 hypothetical protein [Hamadaea flava]